MVFLFFAVFFHLTGRQAGAGYPPRPEKWGRSAAGRCPGQLKPCTPPLLFMPDPAAPALPLADRFLIYNFLRFLVNTP